MRMDIQQLFYNAWDIGTVSGVLQGIELTPTLLPNQKEAIASARKAIERIGERNRIAVEALAVNPHNEKAEARRPGQPKP